MEKGSLSPTVPLSSLSAVVRAHLRTTPASCAAVSPSLSLSLHFLPLSPSAPAVQPPSPPGNTLSDVAGV